MAGRLVWCSRLLLLLLLSVGPASAQSSTNARSKLNCSAPNASFILNALDPPCAEGFFIDPYYYCTTRCRPGYRPDEPVLNCFPDNTKSPAVASLYPPTFYCDADPCVQPVGIANASDPPCSQAAHAPFFPQHASLCIAKCQNGFSPSFANLTCDAGRLYPATFECLPKPCILSSYDFSVNCSEPGDLFFHGTICTPKCAQGYAADVQALHCILGNLTPSAYICTGMPCPAPEVLHAHPSGPCQEGSEVDHGGNCTAQCADGYEPWCSDEREPRFGCQLRCHASEFRTSFVCKGRPCASPNSSSIANAKLSTPWACAEGPLVDHGRSCTPMCQRGYRPNVAALSCSLTRLSPPIFECLGLPCQAPKGIEGAAEVACQEGSTIEHDDVCTARCAFGYKPDNQTLSCRGTVLTPPSFSCLGLDCVVPTDIEDAAEPACDGTPLGGNLSDGSSCTARCAPGFEPSVTSLPCKGSMLRPSRFKCLPSSALENGTRMDDSTLRLGITRHLAMAPLELGTSVVCYRDVSLRRTPQSFCSVVEANVVAIWRGDLVPLTLGEVSALVLAPLQAGYAVACYRDDVRSAGVFCKVLSNSGFDLATSDEKVASASPTWHPALVAVDLPGGLPGALLCYQRGSSACACRALRGGAAAGAPPVVSEELPLEGSLALAVAVAGLAQGVGVVCLVDGLRHRRTHCTALSLAAGPAGGGVVTAAGELHQVSEGEASSLVLARLGPELAVVCFTDRSREEQGVCRILDTSGSGPFVTEGLLPLSSGLTRDLVLAPAGLNKALACYQVSEWLGQQQGRCRVLVHVPERGLISGAAVEVNVGRTWSLTLSRLYDDTALACYTDSSEQGHGKCRVLWGPWGWEVAEARVCTPFDSSCVA